MKRIFTIFMLALPFIVFSQTGKYLEFNGTDQYMQIPTHADFNVQTSESFTITAWVNVIEFKTTMPDILQNVCRVQLLPTNRVTNCGEQIRQLSIMH